MTAASPVRRPAVIVLAVALGLAIGVGAAFLTEAGERPAPPGASRAAPTTTVERDFWTVVLASIEAGRADGRARAEARAEDLRGAGLEDVGVLDSSRYGSLNAGYLVVFSGRFPSREAAERHLRRVRDRDLPAGPAPYVREVRA
jgi:hypothetical protein